MFDPNVEPEFTVRTPEKKPARKHLGLKIAALCLVCAVIGGAAGFGGAYAARQTVAQLDGAAAPATIYESTAPTADAVTVTNLPTGTSLTPAQVYKNNVGSCVGITVSTTTNVFGYTTTSAATGSGFVLTRDGYIATNYHVIEAAAKNSGVPITVSFQNGKSYQAKLVGGEADNDVAVLKIDDSSLTPVTLGDSSQLEVGQAVYAIGNPLGELTYSLTDGLVSALDRVITTGNGSDATSLNMLQTNCAINPGNSGGPLFNEYGQVVGITTAKVSNSGSSGSASVEGLGFAIPINDVKVILTDLIQRGYVTGKPSLGVRISSVSQQDALRYGLRVGAYVESVIDGSCAQRAGLQTGDIIVALDDTEIGSAAALVAAKTQYRAGDTATVTVIRSGQEMKLQLTFDEEKPDTTAAAEPDTSKTPQEEQQQGGRSGQDGYYSWPFGDLFPFSEFFR